MKMKKNDWFLAGAVAVYSYLFYEQASGVNYLLFTLILLVLIMIQTRPWVFRQTSWRLTALGCLISAVNVVLVNSGLAVLANIFSLILLAGFSRMPQASIFISALNSLYSLATSFFNFTFFREKYFPESTGSRTIVLAGLNMNQVFMVGIPLVVTSVFLVLYSIASPAFRNLIWQVDFSFISVSWVLFTFTGFWLLFGFFRQQVLEKFTETDLAAGNTLQRLRHKIVRNFKMADLKYEYKTGIVCLVLLNLLLLAFNLNDAFYLTLGTLPPEIPYSEYLHQGVNMLIISILLAIAVLQYLFRDNLNFLKENQPLKVLAYIWLAQNLILVLLTMTKNSIYVMDFGLTYKRIGVYTYLTLTAIGLVTSFVKVAAVKNNWFLFRKNAWALYLILLLHSFFNWDRVLTSYNLNYAKAPDLSYLHTLSASNLPAIISNPRMNQLPGNEAAIERRSEQALEQLSKQDWQSWNYNDYRLQKELLALKNDLQFVN